jgi:hypothetical protein
MTRKNSVVRGKFGQFWTFVLVSIVLAASTVALWPKPAAVTLAGLSLLATFGGLIALCRATGSAHTNRVRRLIALISGGCSLAFAALALKYHLSAPGFALASLINVALLSLAVVGAFLLTSRAQESL